MLPPVTLVNTKGAAMTRKQILDRASTALPSLTYYYNDQGEYVEGEVDILAAFVAKTLIWNYDADSDLGDGDIISYLTAVLDQAMDDLTMVCKALKTGDVTTWGTMRPRRCSAISGKSQRCLMPQSLPLCWGSLCTLT